MRIAVKMEVEISNMNLLRVDIIFLSSTGRKREEGRK